MFDVEKIAKTIKEKRIEKNMTQVALADFMGVSYQAVSNWERGNSMPDISKLEDLCSVLGISVAELLGIENSETKTVEKIIKNSEEVSIDEIAEVAPILPPETIKAKTEKESHSQKINFRSLSELIEFLDEEYVVGLVHKALEAAKGAARKIDGLFDVIEFIPEKAIFEILKEAGPEDLDSIAECIEDLSDESLDFFAEKCIEFKRTDIIFENAEFFSEKALEKIVDYCLERKMFDELSEIYEFLEQDQLKKIAKALIENDRSEDISDITFYM